MSQYTSYIYIMENLKNGKLYVGQTKDPKKRERAHSHPSSNCRYLQHAIQKYGRQSFEFALLEKCTSLEQTNVREAFWIRELKTLAPYGYNLKIGGDRGILSEETKRRIALANKGHATSLESRAKMRAANPNTDKEDCRNGHLFTTENTGISKEGHRICKTCVRERSKSFYRNSTGKSDEFFEFQKSHCINGHPRTDENTSYFIGTDGRRYKRCKVCHRNKEQLRRRKILKKQQSV